MGADPAGVKPCSWARHWAQQGTAAEPPRQGCLQGEPAPRLPRKFNFWRSPGQLLRAAGALGAALLLPTRGWEVGELEEESHCCWRNLPEAQSQPQVLGLPPTSAFNSLMTFLNNQSNPPILPKRHLTDSSEVVSTNMSVASRVWLQV